MNNNDGNRQEDMGWNIADQRMFERDFEDLVDLLGEAARNDGKVSEESVERLFPSNIKLKQT